MTLGASGGPVSHPGYHVGSRYDDVWAYEAEICAFCAAPYQPAAPRCAGCGRNLVQSSFAYATASTHQVILWVLTASSGFLYLLLILADVIQGNGIGLILIHLLLGLLFLLLTAGIYARQLWAWAASIPLLMVTLFLNFLQVIGVDTTVLLPERLEAMTGPALASSFLQSVISLLYFLLLVAQAGALLWAAVFVAADFTRRSEPTLARLDRHLVNAVDYFTAGRRHAQDGRWASAILHWQRAAAQEPANWRYQLALAEAYAQLGFTSRSADVLQSASALAGSAGAAGIEQLRRRLAQQPAASRQP
jgi:tetratricopeptide (TPR) repeat protein